MPLPDLSSFRNLELPGGFVLSAIEAVPCPLIDPIGRPALAKTTIHGSRIGVVLDEVQPPDEKSISIYHELLEGLSVAVAHAPLSVAEFCEADFEREARAAFIRFGVATPTSVLAFLALFDFR